MIFRTLKSDGDYCGCTQVIKAGEWPVGAIVKGRECKDDGHVDYKEIQSPPSGAF